MGFEIYYLPSKKGKSRVEFRKTIIKLNLFLRFVEVFLYNLYERLTLLKSAFKSCTEVPLYISVIKQLINQFVANKNNFTLNYNGGFILHYI